MHNDILAVGSRDRLPMLATGRYDQYVDTKPNSKEIRKCILHGPYVMTEVTVLAQPATENTPAVPAYKVPKKFKNITPENHAHFDAEAEAIHMILSGIGDDIYSTLDACQIAQEMWVAIERLQQGESLNKQDVKTNLFWEFSKFTSKDGESIESYYSRFNKMMNEIVRNQLEVTTMQVNVQFLQQLQPEWSRFLASKEDSDEEQAQGDKQIQKSLALIAKHFKNIYKPTNNNLRTSSNTKNKNRDASLKNRNENQTGQFVNQRTGDWLDDTDEEPDKQELEAHYMYMAKIQEQPEHINDTYVVEKIDSNVIPDSTDMCDNEGKDDQNIEECDDERVVLANLIANLKLDTDENKRIQK
ncbi:hypothetical protein Tco_0469065 [Tanacetum coccineum]